MIWSSRSTSRACYTFERAHNIIFVLNFFNVLPKVHVSVWLFSSRRWNINSSITSVIFEGTGFLVKIDSVPFSLIYRSLYLAWESSLFFSFVFFFFLLFCFWLLLELDEEELPLEEMEVELFLFRCFLQFILGIF